MIVFGVDLTDEGPTTAGRPANGIRRLGRAIVQAPGPSFADRQDTDRGPGGERAGRVLSVASLVPAMLATAWVVAGFPLAALGLFVPALVVPAFVVVAAILVPSGLSLVRRSAVTMRGPWWATAGTVTVGVGFAVFAALSHSSHVIIRRDAGSYAQIGYWLAHHGTPFYQVPLSAFGSTPSFLGFASPAFYQHDLTIVPQFMTGWPELLAGTDWAGGWTGLLLTPAIIGGCAILAVGGLAARLLGARWAPLASLLTACAWPVLRSAQATLSEPLALLALAASGCLLVDLVLAARKAGSGGVDAGEEVLRGRIRRHCFALGLVLTASGLVRLDFGIDFAFVLPVVGWLWLTGRPGVVPFLAGSVLGGGLGVLDAAFVTRIYVIENWSAVRLMLELLAIVSLVVVAGVLLMRRHGRSPRDLPWWRWVPAVGAGALALAEIGLFVRPWVSTDHSTTDPSVLGYVTTLQRGLGLLVDGTRGYAEQSLRWVAWNVGWPMVIAAGVGAIYLTWRVLQGRDLRWLPIMLTYLCSAVLVLVRPSITPDHPWADRRLVVEVLPCLVLLATWTTGALARRVRGRWLSRLVVAAVIASFLVPMGIALTPIAVERTEQGEPEMIDRVCAALSHDDVIVSIDQQWMPVLREQCGLPVAQLLFPSPVSMNQTAASIRATGRTPVVVGSQMDSPLPLGLTSTIDITLDSREDDRQLVRRPDSTVPLHLRFWAAFP
jgi:hypothetical protein